MKRNIVAMGGGRIMLPEPKKVETLSIDKAIVRMSTVKQPRVLFIPTASEDNEEYCEAIQRLYADHLKCHIDFLLLYRDRPDAKTIRSLIRKADIIYVGGGNTLRMMRYWKQLGVIALLDQARKRGTILCGLSAGAICWFRQGNSDSRKFKDGKNKTLIKVSGLDYVDLLLCPHYDTEKHRQPSLKKMMRTTRGIAVALENCVAIQIKDDAYRILASKKNRFAWLIYSRKGKDYKIKLEPSSAYKKLDSLYPE